MNINATLLVQAGNFFIAYLLFRIILLKPACLIVDQQSSYRDSLHEKVSRGQEHLREKQALQKKQWLQVHQFYNKNRPVFVDKQTIFYGISTVLSFEPCSDEEIKALSCKVGQKIALQLGKVA